MSERDEFLEKQRRNVAEAIERIDKIITPLLLHTELVIKGLEDSGGNPKAHFSSNELQVVDYYARRESLLERRKDSIKVINDKARESLEAFDQKSAENAEEEALSIESLVIAAIEIAFVEGFTLTIGDVKIQWDPDRPFGGSNSDLSQIRDKALRAIGLDPEEGLGKIIKDPSGELEKALTSLNDSASKELTDAKNVFDKALSDAKREVDQELTELRKKIDETAENTAREVEGFIDRNTHDLQRAIKSFGEALGSLLPKITL